MHIDDICCCVYNYSIILNVIATVLDNNSKMLNYFKYVLYLNACYEKGTLVKCSFMGNSKSHFGSFPNYLSFINFHVFPPLTQHNVLESQLLCPKLPTICVKMICVFKYISQVGTR